MAKLINVIFENSSPHRHFREKKLQYEILILSSDSRYFWSVALKVFLHVRRHEGYFASLKSPTVKQISRC